MTVLQHVVIICLAAFWLMTATSIEASNWQITRADTSDEYVNDDISVWSTGASKEELPVSIEISQKRPALNDQTFSYRFRPERQEQVDQKQSGTAWVKSYNKPPGSNVATVYNSDTSVSDNWDPVKDFQLDKSPTTEVNRYFVSKKPDTVVRYGAKTNVQVPSTSNRQTNYPSSRTTEKPQQVLVTAENKDKDKNNKGYVIWTVGNGNRTNDWSLKKIGEKAEWTVNSDYSGSSEQNETAAGTLEPTVQRREPEESNQFVVYNGHTEPYIDFTGGDPKDWKVVGDGGADGWKVLGKQGEVEWQIKYENGSWKVMNEHSIDLLSSKIDVSESLNSNESAYNYDYIGDYGSYYDNPDYKFPDTQNVYWSSNYDNTWPKVTNVATPEPWQDKTAQGTKKFALAWPKPSNFVGKQLDKNSVTTTTTTQKPTVIFNSKQYTTKRGLTTAKPTNRPLLVVKTLEDSTKPNNPSNNSKYYQINSSKYYSGGKGLPQAGVKSFFTVNRNDQIASKNHAIWKPQIKSSEVVVPMQIKSSGNVVPKLNVQQNSNDSTVLDSAKRILRTENDNKKSSDQWITGYGSQTWKAGTGKKEWDTDDSVSDSSGSKISAWGTGYGTKIWKGDEWNSNVVWKTGYGSGMWNSDNGTGTFYFPDDTLDNTGVVPAKEYKDKNSLIKTKVATPGSIKNYTSLNTDSTTLMSDENPLNDPDMSNAEIQENWGDEKAVGGVLWQNSNEYSIGDQKWKFPDETTADDGSKPNTNVGNNLPKLWKNKWAAEPAVPAGPGWKPSNTFYGKSSWKPAIVEEGTWYPVDEGMQVATTIAPVQETTTLKPEPEPEPQNSDSDIKPARGPVIKVYKSNIPQSWRPPVSDDYPTGSFKFYGDYGKKIGGWQNTGKSWNPNIGKVKWIPIGEVMETTNTPVVETTTLKPVEKPGPPTVSTKKNPSSKPVAKVYRPNVPQFSGPPASDDYQVGGWKFYGDYGPSVGGWKNTGKSWNPTVFNKAKWIPTDEVMQTTPPVIETTTLKPEEETEPLMMNMQMNPGNKQVVKFYKPSIPQYWRPPASDDYQTGGWKFYGDYGPAIGGWKNTGKSWRPPVYIWSEEEEDTPITLAPTTIAPTTTTLTSTAPPTIKTPKPTPVFIKWPRPTPSYFKWPVATPAPVKWTKTPVRNWPKPTAPVTKQPRPVVKWQKPTVPVPKWPKPTSKVFKWSVPTTEATTTTSQPPLTTTPEPPTSKPSPPTNYYWPVKTYRPKSWGPIKVAKPSDCKDKDSSQPWTMPDTSPMEPTTPMPMEMTTEKENSGKPDMDGPQIIIITKIPPGYTKIPPGYTKIPPGYTKIPPNFPKISTSGKGKGSPLPPNMKKWRNYKGRPLKSSSTKGKKYYKGTPFKSIQVPKSKKRATKVKVPVWIQTGAKGVNMVPMPNRGSSGKSTFAKLMSSKPFMLQKLKQTKPKSTWRDTWKKIFG